MKLDAAQAARRLAASNDAYLVSRGVRALALCGMCEARPEEMASILDMLREAVGGTGSHDAEPFIFQTGEWAHYGFCSEPWVLSLYKWLTENSGAVPEEHTDAICGMLFGYSPPAISQFLRDEARGRLDASTVSVEPRSR
ncbi:hypothetical protein LCGC14_0334650 [marine sediment metagenome]|uniref:Uncharacterized protein n=1 Tax=marine sediment metagenome TaxID=412755 RepID=A0A0F9TYB6_9ZZZZ